MDPSSPTLQLESCLKAAIQEAELVHDILEACLLTDVNVSNIASWTPSEVAERLFLTPEEADKLVGACRAALGVESGPVESISMPTSSSVLPAEDELPAMPGSETDVVIMGEDVEEVAEVKDVDIKELDELAVPSPVPSPEPRLPSRLSAASPKHELRSERSTIPSFLRPTGSSTRQSKNFQAPVAEKKTPSPSKAKAGIMSRLLAPTAAFLARVTRSKAESKAAREASEAAQALRKSQVLSVMLASPQGQRVTKALPFQLAVDHRPKQLTVLSSVEQELQEAQKQQFKRHVVPAHVREARPIEGFRAHSTPKSPSDVFRPFQLASLDKHAKYTEMRESRLVEEARKADEARRFKAQQMDKVQEVLASPATTPRKVAPAPVTQASAPALSSASRAEHHAKVLDPARRARMSSAEREALEARERKAAEAAREEAEAAERKLAEAAKEAALNIMDVSELRKSMVFKARDLPDFSSPFKPDHSKAAPVTKSIDFSMATTKRLGAALSMRERCDAAAPSLSASACFSPNQFSNLRSSQQLSYKPNASMRLSVTSLSPRSPSSRGPMTPASPSTNLRASTSRLALTSPSARPGSAPFPRTPSSRASIKPSIKEALEVALEVSASPRALSRRATQEVAVHSPAHSPSLMAAI